MKPFFFGRDTRRCMVFLFSIILAYSSVPGAIVQTDENLKEIKKKQYETEKKLREKEKIQKELEQAGTGEEEPGGIVVDNTGFFISEIILQNAELLSEKEKQDLVKPFINREITFNDLTVLVRKITNLLIEKGYITARVKIPVNQNIKSGIVILTVVNGYIEDVVPEKETWRNSMRVFFAFPLFGGNILNIEDLDYGIEQMNKLKSNNATMKIFPGTELGQSKVVIYNEPGRPVTLEAGFDNLGQKATGEYREKFSATIDDILGINDTTYANYTTTVKEDDNRNYNHSYSFFYNFPLGYWTFSGTFSRSEYVQYIYGLNRDFKSSGSDTNRILGIERMLFRHKFDRISGISSLTLKEKESFIEDAKVDVSSRKLTVLKAGLNYTTFLLDGYFSTGAFYHRGLDLFGAYKDEKNLDKDTPRAQFGKYEFELIWNKPFVLAGQSSGYNFSFNGQYGADTLYSSEKITIGDLSTVRGFKNDPVSADRGWYARNELYINDFSYIWNRLKGLKLFTAFDMGYLIEKAGREANYNEGEASFTGYAAGIGYSSVIGSMNLTYARKLLTPEFVNEDKYIVYFSASANLTGIFDEILNIF